MVLDDSGLLYISVPYSLVLYVGKRTAETNPSAHAVIPFRFVTSNCDVDTLSLPCFAAKASSLSFRRPTAMTKLPCEIMRSAMACPRPAVQPIMRTVLYGQPIVLCGDNEGGNQMLQVGMRFIARSHLRLLWT